MPDQREADRLVELGNEHREAGRIAEAEAAYQGAVQANPHWSVPYYDLGLLYKYEGRWRESLEFNQRAAALDPSDEAGWWNLGIAATALGEWAEARRAWNACGLKIPDGEGPLDLAYGSVPLRLDPEGQGEVVWADRFDPARARILSVPLPTSTFRWRDVVLHDGAPEGYRDLNGTKVPVFNVLARLVASPFQTFVLELGTTDEQAIDSLEQVAHDADGAAENWGSSTNILCRKCSFGVPHPHPREERTPAHPHCGVAARDSKHLQAIVDRWLAGSPGADLVRWYPIPGGAA